MNRRNILAFAAGLSAAVFAILYPEYVLLPDTYEYIIMGNEELPKERYSELAEEHNLEKLLFADPDQVVISSCFWERQ